MKTKTNLKAGTTYRINAGLEPSIIVRQEEIPRPPLVTVEGEVLQ